MACGAYLCYEGFEKIAHRFVHGGGDDTEKERKLREAFEDASTDLVAFERDKIKGAVRTDFILSAEIIVITLGTVAGAAFGTQVSVLAGVAVLMTVGVYGIVAGIVKLDDAGAWLMRRAGEGSWARVQRACGTAILSAAPWMMKTLSVVGTAAMFSSAAASWRTVSRGSTRSRTSPRRRRPCPASARRCTLGRCSATRIVGIARARWSSRR
jgi:hypothetical protein